jgi:hypothetical protein
MTQLRLDDTEVAARQTLEAGVAVSVIETFIRLPTAGDTKDGARPDQVERLTQAGIKGHLVSSHR